MSYRCGICEQAVPHGKDRLLHIVYRDNGDIAREVPVCGVCHSMLEGGIPLPLVVAQKGKARSVPMITTVGRPTPLGGRIVERMRDKQGSFPTI